jgi:hypothetical protein
VGYFAIGGGQDQYGVSLNPVILTHLITPVSESGLGMRLEGFPLLRFFPLWLDFLITIIKLKYSMGRFVNRP